MVLVVLDYQYYLLVKENSIHSVNPEFKLNQAPTYQSFVTVLHDQSSVNPTSH